MIFDFRADMPVKNGSLTSYPYAQDYVIKIVYILIMIMISSVIIKTFDNEYIDKRDQNFWLNVSMPWEEGQMLICFNDKY